MRNRLALALVVLLLLFTFSPSHACAQDINDANRKVLTKVVPQYPSLARAMRIQGSVRADVLVEASGKVKGIEVKGGHPVLVQSAEDALRQWKWEPTSHDTHEIVELRFNP
jgi:TonB family protein